ncbi:MAG: hypothetical protein LRY55_09270 [Leadbetterella sp.]|nr:hypothetical protein [Leadbetterella sp.]
MKRDQKPSSRARPLSGKELYEMHDTLITKIAALKWRIESAEKLTPEQLSFVQILDDIYEDLRRIALNL